MYQKNLNEQTIKMAINMFLGLSIGNWTATHLPTLEDPSLTLKYVGKERGGRPFKILNAAARPPKRYRPTIYWAMTETDLEAQVIKFYKLKKKVTAQDVVTDFGACVKTAQAVIKHRECISEKTKARPVDQNLGLRRQARKLARELLGPEARFSVSRENGLHTVVVSVSDKEMGRFTGVEEREAYLKAISALATIYAKAAA